ncbi:hypothetical protein AAFC00_001817 [Neodothiora populina]|uniref:Uncharacterized protein n=1 Tax=Neodothiora populina TaxID=2781224 RepID=A0ABR3PQ93_9PEZI
MSSPPLSPIRQYIPSIESQHVNRRRRSSSYSDNPSPNTARSSYSGHRLSNSSRYSQGLHELNTQLDHIDHNNGGSGGGNLADELEFADEDEEEADADGDMDEDAAGGDDSYRDEQHKRETQPSVQEDGARDSGVDVALRGSTPPHVQSSLSRPQSKQQGQRNFSRPMSRDQEPDSPTSIFSIEMEDAMKAISKLANPPPPPPPPRSEDDVVAAALSSLQNLSSQSTLENHTQRLTTSTNSLSSHLIQQTKLLSSLSSSLFAPFGLATPLDMATIGEVIPEMLQLLQNLPTPDPRTLQGLAKFDRETTDLLRTLASLTDSLQMGKQATSSAARHLRSTHTMVTQLRLESDLAEQAQWKLEKEGWDKKLDERWCARECSDVVGGFEQVCEGLRRGLEESITV